MSSLFTCFKQAPSIDPIQDREEVDCMYKYWRIRILYSMFFGYALYYFTRRSFSFAIPGLIEDLGFTKPELGLVGSIFAIMYGVSKFTSGVLSDRASPRYFMACGLLFTGVVNIFFGLSSSLFMFTFFWGLNGWFQGFGAPPCVRLLTQWYSHSERGTSWAIWSVSHNAGAFLIAWIAGFCLQYAGWRFALYLPGAVCIFGAVLLLNRLRDTPQSIGLPPIDKYHHETRAAVAGSDQSDLSAMRIFIDYILKNKYIWLCAAAYFFVYVVRTGIADWTAQFLIEQKNYSILGASGCVSLFEIGGFFGCLAAGWTSDKVFGAKRGPVNVLFASGMGIAVTAFWYIPEGFQWLDSAAMFLIGFCVFGPQMLVGVAAAELAHKRAVATSNGFISIASNVGSAVAGYPLGRVAQDLGWEGFFYAVLCCCLISVIVLMPLWNVTKNPRLVSTAA